MNKSRNLRNIAILIYAASLVGGIVVLPLTLGFGHPLMRNLAPGAPIEVTIATILVSFGMVCCILLYHISIFTGRSGREGIIEVVACFLLYALAMIPFASDFTVWEIIALIVVASMIFEYFLLSLLMNEPIEEK